MKDLAYDGLASSHLLLILVPAGMNASTSIGGTPASQTLYIENLSEVDVDLTVENQPSDTSVSIPAGTTATVTIAFAVQPTAGVITDNRNVTDDNAADAVVAVLGVVIAVS